MINTPTGTDERAPEDHSTPGPWWVRKPERYGEVVDAFVCAPDVQGFAYDAEILGDDEYRDEKSDGSGLRRKVADCELIVRLVNEHRASLGAAQVPAEPVAEVVLTMKMPGASPAWKPHKIIHASLAWFDANPVGTKLYAQPNPDSWNEAIEAVVKRIEGGSFLHDKSPAKLFANELAPVIRSMKRAPISAGAAQVPSLSEITDEFRGDNDKLVECIGSLLRLDAKGALVPHGIGGHARRLLAASAVRLSAPTAQPTGQAEGETPFAYYVHFPDADRGELVHDLDELTEDLTNERHEITPLYTRPVAAVEPSHII